jgi:prepilin-type N-terminal cleavage/methylation domain-containing protein/prepilin-type processing-associated H-X9-DG protein
MARSHRKTSAFTLVELLVVITIIGVMVGLLLPAVQMIRESARRVTCKSNLGQLGVAAKSHVSAQGFFPSSGWGYKYTGNPNAGFRPVVLDPTSGSLTSTSQSGGWIYNLLPYLGMSNIHDQGLNTSGSMLTSGVATMRSTSVPILICASRRVAVGYPGAVTVSVAGATVPATPLYAKTDYAANAGSYIGSDTSTTTPSSSSTAMDTNYNGVSYRKSQVRDADIEGMSYTIFAAEKYMNSIHYTSGDGASDNNCAFDGFGTQTNRWVPLASASTAQFQQQTQPMQDNLAAAFGSDDPSYRFGSNHASGCNAAFCDGSVRLLQFSIDPRVLTYLGVCSKSSLSGSDYPLSDARMQQIP